MQVRLILALQNLLTLIATGLLPLMAALALLFIGALPFVGFESISARISAAGLLTTLALLLLFLVTIVWHPQRQTLPYYAPLRGMIRLAVATHFAIRLVTRASVRGIDNHRGAGLGDRFLRQRSDSAP
ncbi:hypothetical protein QDR45_003708 [Enterobacter hormaechei]